MPPSSNSRVPKTLISRLRATAARILFRLAYKAAPAHFHSEIFCLPGEHIGRAIVCDGGYEDGLIEIVTGLILEARARAKTVCFVDVGANIGTHTVALSQCYSNAIAFEPNPKVAAALRLNIDSNGIRNAVVRELALSDRVGSRQLIVPAENQGNASIDGSYRDGTRHQLVTSTLDVELNALSGASLSFVIKIDVEGHELEVLEGGNDVLRNRECTIIVEYNRGEKSGTLLEYLGRLGYEPECQIDIPRFRQRPVYRVMSLLGLRNEALAGRFRPNANYIPAVVFRRKSA